jgi:hypothetical protein
MAGLRQQLDTRWRYTCRDDDMRVVAERLMCLGVFVENRFYRSVSTCSESRSTVATPVNVPSNCQNRT